MAFTKADRDAATQLANEVAENQSKLGDIALTVEVDNSELMAAVADLGAKLQTGLTQISDSVATVQTGIQQILDILQAAPKERFPGDPGAGKLYYGLNTDGGDPTARESYCGHIMGVYRSYVSPPGNVNQSIAICKRDLAAGRYPLHSTKLPGPWANCAAGAYDDSFFIPLLEGLGALDGPVGLCLHHEPYDDAPTEGASYKAMYSHVYAMKPDNVALIPILQSSPFDPQSQDYQGKNLLDWVDPASFDVFGFDIYNHWWDGTKFYKYRDVPSMLSFISVAAAALGDVPMAICEYGTRTDPTDLTRAVNWMHDFYDGVVASGKVVAMSYFDSAQNIKDGGNIPYTLDYQGEKSRLDAFKDKLTADGSVFLS